MSKQILSLLSSILMCCAAQASTEVLGAVPAELSAQTDSAAIALPIDANDESAGIVGAAGRMAEHLDGATDDTAHESLPTRPKAKVTVVTVAADKNLVQHEVDPAETVEVMICSRERPPTGSRLKRKKCRTVQQLKREAEFNKIRYNKSSNRFQRTPPRMLRTTGN